MAAPRPRSVHPSSDTPCRRRPAPRRRRNALEIVMTRSPLITSSIRIFDQAHRWASCVYKPTD
jgi:hypothetical protein